MIVLKSCITRMSVVKCFYIQILFLKNLLISAINRQTYIGLESEIH